MYAVRENKVEVESRGDVFQITVSGGSRTETRRIVNAFLASILEDQDHDLNKCIISTSQACRSQSSP
jgi:hypothetical protein